MTFRRGTAVSAVVALPAPKVPIMLFFAPAIGDINGLRGKSATESGVHGSPLTAAAPKVALAVPPLISLLGVGSNGGDACEEDGVDSIEDMVDEVPIDEVEPADVKRRTTDGQSC